MVNNIKKSIVCLFAIVLLSFIACNKEEREAMGETFVYYDYYSDIQHFPTTNNNNLNSKRVCYDVWNDRVAWEVKNENPMPPGYEHCYVSYAGFAYTSSFLKGDYLIKIFFSADIPTEKLPANGIYFQKINKNTGIAEVSRKIISPSEFNPNIGFIISSVVSDGNSYFFACNNGYVYGFDENGNLKWKKGNYPMTNVWGGGGSAEAAFSYIYCNDNKVFFISEISSAPNAKVLYCLDSNTGNELWWAYVHYEAFPKQIFFDANHVFDLGKDGALQIINKQTGLQIDVSDPPAGGIYGFARPIGKIDDRFAAFFTKELNIAHVELAHPAFPTLTYLTNVQIDNNYTLDNGLVYAGNANGGYPTFNFYCINPLDGVKWSLALPHANPPLVPYGNLVYDYKISGNYIYLLTTFHIEGNKCINNETRTVNLPSYGIREIPYPGIIVLDKNSGAIVKQCKKIPVGFDDSRLSNFNVGK
jgi:hypothetical protein